MTTTVNDDTRWITMDREHQERLNRINMEGQAKCSLVLMEIQISTIRNFLCLEGMDTSILLETSRKLEANAIELNNSLKESLSCS